MHTNTLITTLEIRLPDLIVKAGTSLDRPSVADGPVLLVSEENDHIHLALFTDEGDPLADIAKMVYISAIQAPIPTAYPIKLRFAHMTPILDESAFQIGECLSFTPLILANA